MVHCDDKDHILVCFPGKTMSIPKAFDKLFIISSIGNKATRIMGSSFSEK